MLRCVQDDSSCDGRSTGEDGGAVGVAEGSLEDLEEEVASLYGEHGAEGDNALAFEADGGTAPVIPTPAAHAGVAFAHGAEVGKRAGAGPADGADAEENGELIGVASDCHLAGNARCAHGNQEECADQEWNAKE